MTNQPEQLSAEFRLSAKHQAYLTGLAMLDKTTLGTQVRSAVNQYGEGNLRPFFDTIGDVSSLKLPCLVEVQYPRTMLARMANIAMQAADESIPFDAGLHAVLGHYVAERLADPLLAEKVQAAMDWA